jgi:hypothetical protein
MRAARAGTSIKTVAAGGGGSDDDSSDLEDLIDELMWERVPLLHVGAASAYPYEIFVGILAASAEKATGTDHPTLDSIKQSNTV